MMVLGGTWVRCCSVVCTSLLSQSVREEVRSPWSSPDLGFSPQIHLSLSWSSLARFTDTSGSGKWMWKTMRYAAYDWQGGHLTLRNGAVVHLSSRVDAY